MRGGFDDWLVLLTHLEEEEWDSDLLFGTAMQLDAVVTPERVADLLMEAKANSPLLPANPMGR